MAKNSIPTEFWVECIEVDENVDENNIEKTKGDDADNNEGTQNKELSTALLKQKFDFEIQEIKLREQIKRLQIVNDGQSTEIIALKKSLKSQMNKTEELERDLSIKNQTPDSIQVCVYDFFNILIF